MSMTGTALRVLSWLAALALGLVTAASFLGGLWWAFDLAAHFRPQDEQLDRAARLAAQAPAGGVVLLGDLNLTPWSPRFRDLLDDAGLRDASMQLPFEPTWRAPLPFLGLAIDHVLTSPGLAVTCSRIGADVGSDHLPVIADIGIAEDVTP
jgi:endonuclease/exonuclease/phosphatase (EEP) superfamily protein YafD